MIKSFAERWQEIQALHMPEQTATSVLVATTTVEAEFGPIDFNIGLSYRSRIVEGALACCYKKDNTIKLAKEYFKESSFETLETVIEQTIKNKFHPKTKLRVTSIVVHELCHAIWNTIEKKGVKLVDEVLPVMKKWVKDQEKAKKAFFFTYAATNIYEFWAEMLMQALCGRPDAYTEQIKSIAHKYMDNAQTEEVKV